MPCSGFKLGRTQSFSVLAVNRHMRRTLSTRTRMPRVGPAKCKECPATDA
jgi:hypothetical protein